MPLDHSLTYKKKSFRNIVHRGRLKSILSVLRNNRVADLGDSYLDIGCSNGYITDIISTTFKFSNSVGMDHNRENLEIARKTHEHIEFAFVDLNVPANADNQRYNLITCFETLEHVGNLEAAVPRILSYAQKDSYFILISVPIEIGFRGIVKFILKKVFYGYSLAELPNNVSARSYFIDLLRNKNMSKYRDERKGWGTHFGFDYREVDKVLNANNCKYKAINKLTTRFYHIKSQFQDLH